MDFALPELLWTLLLAPLVALLMVWAWRRRRRADAAWAGRALWDRLRPGYRSGRWSVQVLAVSVAVAALLIALARPRWGLSEQQIERRGVDIVFVLDTSLSMAADDVAPNRLWVAQALVRRLVRALPGNRIALVQAEGDGVVMAPLTVDAAVIDLLLDAVQPGVLPTPGTELAAALERALALFPDEGEKHRVLILLSDGEDHGSDLRRVGQALRDAGVRVHAIGVGTPEGTPLALPPASDAAAGATPVYKRDADGQVVVTRLQEDALRRLADVSDGSYVRAADAATDLRTIVSPVRGMTGRSLGNETVSALEERFQWPLALAALALAVSLIWPASAGTRAASLEDSR
ncbi:MAG: VWA domain-containing protein [Acidobacteriota bacterium]